MAMRANDLIRVELDLPVAVAEMLVAVGVAAAAALDPDAADQRADQVAALAATAIVAIANGVRQNLPEAKAGGLGDAAPPAFAEPAPGLNRGAGSAGATQHDRIIADVGTVLAGIPDGQRGDGLRPKVLLERLDAAGADWLLGQPRARRLARLGSAVWVEARKPHGRLRSTRRGYYRLTAKGC